MQRTPALILVRHCAGGRSSSSASSSSAMRSRSGVPGPSAEPSASFDGLRHPPALNAELLDRRWTVLYVGTDVNQERADRGERAVNTDALDAREPVRGPVRADARVAAARHHRRAPCRDRRTWSAQGQRRLQNDLGLDTLVGAMESLYDVPIDAHVVLDMEDFAGAGRRGRWSRGRRWRSRSSIRPRTSTSRPASRCSRRGSGARLRPHAGRPGLRADGATAGGARGHFVERLVDPEIELDVRALLDGFESLETDLPLDDLPTLIELARRAADAEVTNLVIQPPLITFAGDRNDGRGYVLEADIEADPRRGAGADQRLRAAQRAADEPLRAWPALNAVRRDDVNGRPRLGEPQLEALCGLR